MTDKKTDSTGKKSLLTSRRKLIKGLGAAAGAGAALGLMPGSMRYIQAASSAPIKIGFQAHRTGIGAAYGRWYERTTKAAVKAINDAGGINGRPIEMVIEDDGTDPKRGAEVVGEVRHRAQGRRGLRHAVLPCGDRLGAGGGRAEAALFRGQRRPPCRVGHAQPLRVPARHHRREIPGDLDGALDRRQSRQEGHDDLPGFRLRPRSPRLLLRSHRQAGRPSHRADRDPADRDAPSPSTSRRSRPIPR